MSAVETVVNAVVKVGSLIDGTGAPVRLNAFLTIKDGVIQTISGVMPPDIAGTTPFIDLGDSTVLPAFVDSHVHLCMSADLEGEDRVKQFSAGFDASRPMIDDHIAQAVEAGVLTVRDGGDGGDAGAHVVRYRQTCGDRHPSFFRLMTSGRAWYKPGRYGRIVGGKPLPGKNFLKAIEKQLETCDQVKLINSGLNSLTVFGEQTKPQFVPDELKAIVRLAKKNKRHVMVHANGEAPVAEAVAAGVTSIEHGFFMGRENLSKMADRGVFWVPTAGTMKAFMRVRRDDENVVARTLEDQLQQIAWARKKGVRIALGTDAGSPGVPHGWGVARELGLLIEAGYAVEEAVQCATANGAELLNLPDRGTLTPEKQACFIAVPGGRDDIPKNLSKLRIFVV